MENVTSAIGEESPEKKEEGVLNKEDLDLVFGEMEALYGKLWSVSADKLKATIRGTWGRILKDVSTKKIHAGLAKLGDQGSEYPPTPMTFKRLCLGLRDSSHASAAYTEINNSKSNFGGVSSQGTREYWMEKSAKIEAESAARTPEEKAAHIKKMIDAGILVKLGSKNKYEYKEISDEQERGD